MLKPIFSLRDSKTFWSAPFIEETPDAAIRGFAFSLNHSDSLMGFNPADFSLYQIGSFDTSNGSILPLSVPDFIVSGDSLVRSGNDA